MIKQGLLFIGTLLFLTGCINVPIPMGDGNTLKIGTDGITFVDENNNEHSINIDEENETFSIQGIDEDGEAYKVSLDDEDGNFNFNFSGNGQDNNWVIGENLELPFDLPEGVPFANDANIYQYGNLENNMSVNYLTRESLDQINDMYESYFNSSSFVEGPDKTEMSDDNTSIKILRATTRENYVIVTVSKESNEDEVNVSITVQSVNE